MSTTGSGGYDRRDPIVAEPFKVPKLTRKRIIAGRTFGWIRFFSLLPLIFLLGALTVIALSILAVQLAGPGATPWPSMVLFGLYWVVISVAVYLGARIIEAQIARYKFEKAYRAEYTPVADTTELDEDTYVESVDRRVVRPAPDPELVLRPATRRPVTRIEPAARPYGSDTGHPATETGRLPYVEPVYTRPDGDDDRPAS